MLLGIIWQLLHILAVEQYSKQGIVFDNSKSYVSLHMKFHVNKNQLLDMTSKICCII